MNATAIPYGDLSWSVVTGCSNACPYCWSRALAHRFGRSFEPTFHALKLAEPLHRRKPARILVSFNGDLFDSAVSDEQIAAVFGVMAACPQHRFFVLTKRAERMAQAFEFMQRPRGTSVDIYVQAVAHGLVEGFPVHRVTGVLKSEPWPLPNVLLGVSVTNQADADARIPHLLKCPAAVRWLSVEPLLGPVDLGAWLPLEGKDGGCTRCGCNWDYSEHDSGHHECPPGFVAESLHWIAAGAISGPRARPCDPSWARGLRDQCAAAGVPFCWKNPTGYPPLDGVVHDATPEGK